MAILLRIRTGNAETGECAELADAEFPLFIAEDALRMTPEEILSDIAVDRQQHPALRRLMIDEHQFVFQTGEIEAAV